MGNVLVWTPPISIHIKNSSSPLYFSLKVWLLRPPSSTPLAFMDLLWGVFIFSPFAQSECWISISKPNSHKCKKYRHISDQQRNLNVVYSFLVHTFFSYLATQLACNAGVFWRARVGFKLGRGLERDQNASQEVGVRKRLGERQKCVPGSGS